MMMNKLQMMERIKKVILNNCYTGMSISGGLLGEGKTPEILRAYTEEFLNHATETPQLRKENKTIHNTTIKLYVIDDDHNHQAQSQSPFRLTHDNHKLVSSTR